MVGFVDGRFVGEMDGKLLGLEEGADDGVTVGDILVGDTVGF